MVELYALVGLVGLWCLIALFDWKCCRLCGAPAKRCKCCNP